MDYPNERLIRFVEGEIAASTSLTPWSFDELKDIFITTPRSQFLAKYEGRIGRGKTSYNRYKARILWLAEHPDEMTTEPGITLSGPPTVLIQELPINGIGDIPGVMGTSSLETDADVRRLLETTIEQQRSLLALEKAVDVVDFTVPDTGDGLPIVLASSSDWHVGHIACQHEKLRNDMELMAAFPYLYYAGLGDFADNPKAGNEKTGSSLYEQVISSPQRAYRLVEYFLSIIPATRHVCLVGGNHDNRNFNTAGLDMLEPIAEKMGIKYGGPGCILRLSVGGQRYIVALRHKYRNRNGAKMLVTGFAYPEPIDLSIIGHHHEFEQTQADFKGRRYTALKNGTYLTMGSPNYEQQMGDAGQTGVSAAILFPDRKEIIAAPNFTTALEIVARYRGDAAGLERIKAYRATL